MSPLGISPLGSGLNDLTLTAAVAAGKKTPALLVPKTAAGIDKVAQEFEAVFINEMLGSMFEGIQTDSTFGGGPGEAMFRSMMIDKYAHTIAAQGGFGLATTVKRELLHLQEAPQ